MHISEQQLHLLLQDQLPQDELLQIEDHLIECQACATMLADFVTSGQSLERRRQARSACDIAAHIYVLSPAEMRTDGRVIETSKDGLKVRLPKPLLPGSLVQVRTNDVIFMGEVRHCRDVLGAFEAGVRVIVTTQLTARNE